MEKKYFVRAVRGNCHEPVAVPDPEAGEALIAAAEGIAAARKVLPHHAAEDLEEICRVNRALYRLIHGAKFAVIWTAVDDSYGTDAYEADDGSVSTYAWSAQPDPSRGRIHGIPHGREVRYVSGDGLSSLAARRAKAQALADFHG